MSDLVFTTRGQAELLASQEEVRRKALETRQEFEEAAKATGSWDAATMKLKSSAETALRSVHSEQEKILDKISKIQQAQEKGLIPPEAAKDAEEALTKLRQQWIDVDEATIKAKEDQAKAAEETARVEEEAAAATAQAKREAAEETRKQEAAYASLKSTAESALRSIQTEEEAIEDKIHDIEAAIEQGLFSGADIDKAEEGLERLKDQLKEMQDRTDEVGGAGNKLGAVFSKAFDPTQLAKFVAGFVGVQAIIGQVREEFESLQTAVDKRIAANLGPKAQGDQLAEAAMAMDKAHTDAQLRHKQRLEDFEKAKQKEAAAEPNSVARAKAHAETQEAEQAWKRSIDEVNAASDMATAAGRERDEFMGTPGYRKAAALDFRKKIPEQLYSGLSEMGDATQLTTEELTRLADSFRELGQMELATKLNDFVARIDDGTVSIAEVQKQLEIMADAVRGIAPGTTSGNAMSPSGYMDVRQGRLRSDAELSPAEKRQIELLERANQLYEETLNTLRDGGIVGENT